MTKARGEAAYNPWRTYVVAREEARCRGDRRIGTEHLLVALLLEPELASIVGADAGAARAGLARLDREALAAVGVGAELEEGVPVPAPPTALARRPTLRVVLTGRLPLTPVAKKALETSWKVSRGRRRLGEKYLLATLVELERPDPAAELLAHLGVDTATVRERLPRV